MPPSYGRAVAAAVFVFALTFPHTPTPTPASSRSATPIPTPSSSGAASSQRSSRWRTTSQHRSSAFSRTPPTQMIKTRRRNILPARNRPRPRSQHRQIQTQQHPQQIKILQQRRSGTSQMQHLTTQRIIQMSSPPFQHPLTRPQER